MSGGRFPTGNRRLTPEPVRPIAGVARGATGRSELPKALLAPMQRQLELVQDVVERERKLRADIFGGLLDPMDSVLDLLDPMDSVLDLLGERPRVRQNLRKRTASTTKKASREKQP